MVNRKIFSTEECDELIGYLNDFDKNVVECCDDIKKAISIFNNNSTVQSLYASGRFGKGMEEKLAEVESAVRRYYEVISAESGLISSTKLIIAKQRELLENKINGGF